MDEIIIEEKDSLFEDAAKLVVNIHHASTASLGRRFKIGYMRSLRILNQLEKSGIVGEDNGTKPRKVLIQTSEALEDVLKRIK